MTKHYNKSSQTEKRRQLRHNQTYVEKIVWLHPGNRKSKGCKFRRQYLVDRYVIDFYCAELKFAVELDGDVHNLPDQIEHDKKNKSIWKNLA